MADRARAAELDRTGRAEIVHDTTSATGAVKAGEGEHLAAHEPARLVGIHHPGQRWNDHCTGRNGPQNQTRKHAATPT